MTAAGAGVQVELSAIERPQHERLSAYGHVTESVAGSRSYESTRSVDDRTLKSRLVEHMIYAWSACGSLQSQAPRLAATLGQRLERASSRLL
jgi:hypothetical protein